jgi:hypothetical protein
MYKPITIFIKETIMCTNRSKKTCCQNPEELKDNAKKCSKKQIQKCHGNVKHHPCVNVKKENKK